MASTKPWSAPLIFLLPLLSRGKKDKDFCLVTDTNLHINGRLIGRRGDGMKRDFTWVTRWDDAVDQLVIGFDGEPLSLPTTENAERTAADSSLTITRSGSTTNEVVLEAPNNFRIAAKVVYITKQDSKVHRYCIPDDNCFAHLDLAFRFYSLTGSVNGEPSQDWPEDARLGRRSRVFLVRTFHHRLRCGEVQGSQAQQCGGCDTGA
ncbi:hypothetical protein EJ110_NYTH15809 [Nymphaea thermarum]|nr:hypothetical protein EJ110_NYTH15809 [Nymphaea thermarum]